MASMTSAGSSIAIGLAPATNTLVGLQAVSYSPIGEVTNIGSFGKKFNTVTHNPLANRQTIKRKGSYDNGTINLEAAYDNADPGQILLRTASDSDDSYSIRVTMQDATTFYFTAQVFSFDTSVGGVDDITSIACDLEIDGTIFEA